MPVRVPRQRKRACANGSKPAVFCCGSPVRLRRGGRTIGGALSWETPAKLAPFAADIPFTGLAIPADVTVSRQVLAEPDLDLAGKSWARLADGTPLVTAEKLGQGWTVLVHSTANAEWSDLALSGLFVQMLRRIVAMSQGVAAATEGALPPIETLARSPEVDIRPPLLTAAFLLALVDLLIAYALRGLLRRRLAGAAAGLLLALLMLPAGAAR